MAQNKLDLIDRAALIRMLEDMEAQACDGTENDGTDGTTRIEYPVPTTTREMMDLIAAQPDVGVLYEIRKDGVVCCHSHLENCGHSSQTIKEMQAAGFELYADGKKVKTRRK